MLFPARGSSILRIWKEMLVQAAMGQRYIVRNTYQQISYSSTNLRIWTKYRSKIVHYINYKQVQSSAKVQAELKHFFKIKRAIRLISNR